MTPAETILRLIETVDPQDTEKLDEIDARVWVYLVNGDFLGFDSRGNIEYTRIEDDGKPIPFCAEQYTRSRDALKAMGPSGYAVETLDSVFVNECRCKLLSEDMDTQFERTHMPTIELAELHARIQAIQFEREGKC